jgi:nicotinamidase-related amidase
LRVKQGDDTGLIIVDVVNGFFTPGAGKLAPRVADPVIDGVLDAINNLALPFVSFGQPVLATRDCHPDGKEYPWLDHCAEGSFETELVEKISWLQDRHPNVEIIKKGCISTITGSTFRSRSYPDYFRFASLDWLRQNRLKKVVVVGMCSDLCVMKVCLDVIEWFNLVLPPLTPGGDTDDPEQVKVLPDLEQGGVYAFIPGITTYDFPLKVVKGVGAPEKNAHPRILANHFALYHLQLNGIKLIDSIVFES